MIVIDTEVVVTRMVLTDVLCEWWKECRQYARYSTGETDICTRHLSRAINEGLLE